MVNLYPPANGVNLGNYFASPEIIEVKIHNRQIDRHIFDTVYGWVLAGV